MKKYTALFLTLLLLGTLFAGCTGDKKPMVSPSGSPKTSATPNVTTSPTIAPTLTPTPSTMPTPSPNGPQISPSPSDASGNAHVKTPAPDAGLTGNSMKTYDSALGYRLDFSGTSFAGTQINGGDVFAAQSAYPGGDLRITVSAITAFDGRQLSELLGLLHPSAMTRYAAELGSEPYEVELLQGTEGEQDLRCYILDCGTKLLFITVSSPAGDAEAADAADALLNTLRLAGETELQRLLSLADRAYDPGSAGSGLRAASIAGRLLDWYVENRPEPDWLSRAAGSFAAGLKDASDKRFSERLESIYGAAMLLTGENGDALLESSGYAARNAPWSETDAELLFTMLLDGVPS